MKKKNTAFTLVEILIVVIILGILAAIVIPQFSEASNEARLAGLQSDLQTIRSQVELYKIQHLDNTPQDDATTESTDFWTQLTTKTNIDGSSGGDLGPYIMKAPTNPFRSSDAVFIGAPAGAAATDGWAFDTSTNTFYAVGTGPDSEDLSTY